MNKGCKVWKLGKANEKVEKNNNRQKNKEKQEKKKTKQNKTNKRKETHTKQNKTKDKTWVIGLAEDKTFCF